MDTELLKTFLEVDRVGHFGRAAENLHVTPAAVSARIRQLEDLLGQPLFLRERRQIALTPAGEQLRPLAQDILTTWSRVLQDIALVKGDHNRFALGATASLWECLLQDVLMHWHGPGSAAPLQAVCHDTSYLLAQLQSGQLDVAVMFDPVQLDGIVREHAGDLELVLACSSPRQAAANAFAHHYVQVDWGVSFATRHARLPEAGNPVLRAGTGRIGLAWVLAHGGALYLPKHEARARFRAGELHPVEDAPEIIQPLYLTYCGERVQGRAVLAAVRSLAEAIAARLSGEPSS